MEDLDRRVKMMAKRKQRVVGVGEKRDTEEAEEEERVKEEKEAAKEEKLRKKEERAKRLEEREARLAAAAEAGEGEAGTGLAAAPASPPRVRPVDSAADRPGSATPPVATLRFAHLSSPRAAVAG